MKSITLIILTLTSFSVRAELESIHCQTSNGIKSFKVEKNRIALDLGREDSSRLPASSLVVDAKSVRKGESIDKHFKHNGLSYTLHFEKTQSFSELDDYVVIKNREGHAMTYPLSCGLE